MVSNIGDYAMSGRQQSLTNPIINTNETNYQTHNLNKKRKKFFLYKMLNEHHNKDQSRNVFVHIDKVKASTDNLNSFKFNEVEVCEAKSKELRKESLKNVTAIKIEHLKSIKTANITTSTMELCPICRKRVIDNDENDLRYKSLCICRHQLEISQRVIRKYCRKQRKKHLYQHQKHENLDKRWPHSYNICKNKYAHIYRHDHNHQKAQQLLQHIQEQKDNSNLSVKVAHLLNGKQYYQQQSSVHSVYENYITNGIKAVPLAAILSTPKAVSYLNNISSLEIITTKILIAVAIDNYIHNNAKTLALIILSCNKNIANDVLNDKSMCKEIPIAATTIRTNSKSVPNYKSEEYQLEHSLQNNHRHHYCCKTQHTAAITVTAAAVAAAAAAAAANIINSCWQKLFVRCLKILQFILIFLPMQLENNLFNNNNRLKRQPIEPQQQQYIQQEQCSSSIRLIDFFLNNIIYHNNNNNNSNSSISSKQNYQYVIPQQNIYHHLNIQIIDNNKSSNINDTSAGKYPKTNTSHVKVQKLQQQQKLEQFQQQQQNHHHHQQQQQQQHRKQQQQQQQYCHREISFMNITSSSSLSSIPLSVKCSTKNTFSNVTKFVHTKMFVILLSFLMFLLPVTCAQLSSSATATIPPTKISIASPTTTATVKTPLSSVVRLARKEVVCPSMDMRNTPSALKLLKNCTVIEGFLLFTLVNTKNSEEFNETYPLLTEVTEFIVLFRVHKLRSLGQIFPNLSIIRGAELFSAAYALVIFSNPELEEIGLSNLISIPRGGVRIQGNKYLCFANTVDWKEITSNGADIYVKDNRPTEDCPRCPGSYIRNEESSDATDDVLTCKKNNGEHRCWNNNACQKICPKECPHNCYDENRCCNPACLGGCTNNVNECISCRNFSIHNSTCEDKCPSGYFSYLNRRCITAETCKRIGTKFEYDKESELVAFENECTTRCPQNYRLVNKTCEKCEKVCKRTCVGGIIDEVDRAKDFHGCTEIIDVGLSITIKRGGRHVYEALEFGLSSIQTIRTYLKVHNTYGMVSLSFFKNLESIGGEKLLDDRFALYVLENNDLARLWATNQTVKIENGNIYFHFNPKLCYSTIMALKPMMNDSTQIGPYEVSTDSNGSKVSCGKTILNATVVRIGSDMAEIIITNPVDYPDQRAFIGYQLLYMKNEEKNATKFDYNPCDAKWKLTDPYKTNTTIIDKLKPYTQYVFYIKTKTISSERNNVESPLYYFKTKSSQPTFVRDIKAYATSDSEILVNWLPPLMANGKLVTYNVSITIDNRPSADTRNYCKLLDKPDTKPLEKVPPPEIPPQQPGTQQCATDNDSKSGSTGKGANKYLDDESVIDDFIAFENAIHNFVYIKKKGNIGRPNPINISAINISNSGKLDKEISNKVRKRRSTELKTEYIFLSRHTRGVTNAILDNDINDTTIIIFDSRMDKNNLYYEEYTANVSSTTTQFKFEKLKPYSRYFVSVKACREPEEGASGAECSNEKRDDVRTLKRENVDIVRKFDAVVEVTNSSRGNVRLRWDPPEFPNGAVVSYTIEYQLQAQDAATEKKCVTEMDYLNMTNGYLLTGLSTGNYSIRVRANTIAGDGIFSAYKFVYIKPIQLSGTVIAIIIITVLLLVLLIMGGGIYVRKKMLAPPSELTMFPTVNPYYMSPPYIPDEWEVPRERIIQLNPLGQGSFGMVYEGILKGYDNSTEDTLCAIKTTNENATDRERINFLNEASVMKEFDTHHVVRLLGVCSRGQPALVIMELMKNGDLKSYLRAHRPDEQREDIGLPMLSGGSQPPPLSRIYQMAIEIADGMAYLAAKKYVHRDLAARNCMVAGDLTVKIGDFGMTRDIYETDYYRKGTKGLLPVRWMPPESLRDGVYSNASDVFSYGVVLWEMATLAAQPYQGYSNDQVLHHVIDGGVMERPDNCPDRLYSLMQKCWLYRPSARPSFMEIIRLLNDMADPHFEEVSFYNSPEGQQLLSKQLAAKSHRPDDIYDEHDNNMDDATTPLHIGDYSGYKLNMANNFSIENQDESPMITVDDNLHSPYSLGSGIIVNSASDGQSKNSFSLSHKLHNPSIGGGGGGGPPPQYSSASNLQHQHQYKSLQSNYQQNDENVGTETDDGGYQVYDPSPNYREHGPYGAGDCNDDIDNDVEGFGLDSKLSGGQNLLIGQKAGKRFPTIMPISSSMPDDIIRGGGTTPMVASSLHPSTASAASSNASSTATATGKRQSLKKAMAESLMPSRFLSKNRLFFQHKRSGSNSSHKSTGSNAGVSGVSNNGSGSVLGTQQILSTIESGGSGSAGSYCITPPTQKSSSTPADGTGYKLLDESANISGMSEQLILNKPSTGITKTTATTPLITTATTVTPTPTATATSTKTKPAPLTGLTTSFNPNYQLWDKLFHTSSDETETANTKSAIEVSENPNYVMMNEPFKAPTIESLQTNVAMTTPARTTTTTTAATKLTSPAIPTTKSSTIPIEVENISVNPNYLTMTPHTTQLKLPLKNSLSLSSPTCSASSISEEDEADDDEADEDNVQEKQIGEHIPMIRLSQQQQQQQQQQEKLSTKTKDISSSKRKPANVRQRSQKQHKQRRQPPPNGFIGPETT